MHVAFAFFLLGHYVFLCFRRARALDLIRALQKKHVFFFCPARALDCCRFPKKNKLISGNKKYFGSYVFFACFFRRPHYLFKKGQ